MAGRYFHAYIDEAGDEGFTTPELHGVGSSEWLVLAGVLVPEERDLELSKAVDSLRSLLGKPPPKPLHFRKLRQHGQKRAAMSELAKWPFTFSVVAIRKPGLTSSYLRKPPHLYNYAARFLVERLSWYADDRDRKLRLYFENRASTSYSELEDYMKWIQNDPACSIRADCVETYQPVAATEKLAQVADFYASASAAAFERDQYGFPTPDYLQQVAGQLYCDSGDVRAEGLKIFPHVDETQYTWISQV